MKRVLKWSVPVDDRDHPIGAGRVVLVECQYSAAVVNVWTEETPQSVERIRRVRAYGTGHTVPDGDEWIGSTMANPRLVWHLFGREVEK